MKEYKCIEIENEGYETQKKLNKLAKENWKLICSYAWHNHWLILERNKKEVKK